MSWDRTEHAGGNEVFVPSPGDRLGRRDRRLESLLAGRLGPRSAVLFRDGGAGEDRPGLVYGMCPALRGVGGRVGS
jgi:hypothetical protein